MKHDHQPMKARDLRMRMREHRRPSRVILARVGGEGGRQHTHTHTATAKVLVSSFSHSTKPDKGDPGATLGGLQGRDITSSQKEVDKMPNANEERIKWKSFWRVPPPQQLHSHCLGSRLRPQRRRSDGRIGIRLSVDGGFGEKRAEIENECELHDSLPPSSLLLFSALSPSPTSPPMSVSLCLPVSPSSSLSLSLSLQGI